MLRVEEVNKIVVGYKEGDGDEFMNEAHYAQLKAFKGARTSLASVPKR